MGKMKILKFSASWCVPCKTQERLLHETAINADIESLDVEEDFEEVDKYGIRHVPTMILLDEDGNEVTRWDKVTSPLEINLTIEKHRQSRE